ncbi:MAG: tetratricopeptide repeat protein [Phycisphaerales bacterium]|nr:MAG: tetratricopeptide repeat protein [Phycisphaerales bacterium]
MLRDRRAIVLATVTLIAAGCAGSDNKISRHRRETWRPVSDAAVAKARDARVPKILPETHFAAARLFESQGDFRRAITQYRRAVAVNHNYVEAYHRLGLLLSMTGQRQEAIATLGRAVELKPDSAVLHNNLGFELMLGKRWREAQREFLRAIELKPNFARAYINLGIVQSRLGWFDNALTTFQAILPPADAYYNLGLMYRGQRRYSEAARTFQHVLSLNPDFIAAQRQLDQMASHTGPEGLAEGETHPGEAGFEAVGAAQSAQAAPDRQLTTAAAFDETCETEGVRAPATVAQHTADASSWDRVLARLEDTLAPSDAASTVRPSSHTDRKKRNQIVKPWTVDQPKSPPPIDKDRSAGPRVDSEQSWADFEALAFASDAEDAVFQGACWGESATPACDATAMDESTSRDFVSNRPVSITEPREADVVGDWPEAAAWATEPWMDEEPCEEDVLLVDADAAMFLTLRPSAQRAPAIPGIHETTTQYETFEPFEADKTAPEFFAKERTPVTYEQVSYAETEPGLCIADAGEWKVCPFEPADERPAAATSCTDSWALLRELESQLAIVRNEIACLDRPGVAAVEAITSAGSTDAPGTIGLPLFLAADDDQFVGPPAELAHMPEPTRSKTRPARLVSDVVNDQASRRSDKAKRTRKPTTEFKQDGPAERQRQQSDKPAKEKPTKRRTPTARSMSRPGTFAIPEDGSATFRHDSSEWSATGAYGFPTASPFAILDADLHPERIPRGTFGWTCQMPKPSDDDEESTVPAMDLYYDIRGVCGHHIAPLPD